MRKKLPEWFVRYLNRLDPDLREQLIKRINKLGAKGFGKIVLEELLELDASE